MARNKTRYHTFSSTPAFLEETAKPPLWESAHSVHQPASFSANVTFDGAHQLAREGWPEGRRRILTGLDRAAAITQPAPQPAISYDVAGAVPDVPAFCAGAPDHMMLFEPQAQRQAPILRFLVNRATSAIFSAEEIENYGVAILSHLDRLEAEGFSIELSFYMGITKDGRTHYFQAPIKEAGSPIDWDRTAFTLAHPAMLRRLGFRALERYADERIFGGTYGQPKPLDDNELEPATIHFKGPNYGRRPAWPSPEQAAAELGEQIEGKLAEWNLRGDQDDAQHT